MVDIKQDEKQDEKKEYLKANKEYLEIRGILKTYKEDLSSIINVNKDLIFQNDREKYQTLNFNYVHPTIDELWKNNIKVEFKNDQTKTESLFKRVNSICRMYTGNEVKLDDFIKAILKVREYYRQMRNVLSLQENYLRQCEKSKSQECQAYFLVAYIKHIPMGFISVFHDPFQRYEIWTLDKTSYDSTPTDDKFIIMEGISGTISFLLARQILHNVKLPKLNDVLVDAVKKEAKRLDASYIVVRSLQPQDALLKKYYGFQSVEYFNYKICNIIFSVIGSEPLVLKIR